jgi:3'(2'), 5'-bisphosphate nucleotidase
MDNTGLLDLAVALALDASELILSRRLRGYRSESKADLSVITEADRASEAVILRGLRAACPDIAVVAEEEVSAGLVPARRDRVWYVDPLDGTRDFAAERDNFTVNIGLVQDGRPVLGVVAEPAAARIYAGIVGEYAFVKDAAGRRPLRARTMPESGAHVLTAREDIPEAMWLSVLGTTKIARWERLGSALKFCRLAMGQADIYLRAGRSMAWDTAGPEAVLLAAGGSLRDLCGKNLDYAAADFVNSSFVARGK